MTEQRGRGGRSGPTAPDSGPRPRRSPHVAGALGDVPSVGDAPDRVRFGILGPLDVVRPDGVTPRMGPKLRVLLAGLLLHANRVVTVDQLGRWLTDDAPLAPVPPRNRVQIYVMRLRRLVGEQVVATVPGGYLLPADRDQLDHLRFRSLVRAARQAVAHGDDVVAAQRFHAALALWRGDPLPDVASHLLHRDEVDHLVEQRNAALESWAGACLRLGHHDLVVGALRRAAHENPLRERLREQLMIALYRAGRQADALAEYQKIRRLLDDELGVYPGPDLVAIHHGILSHTLQAAERTRMRAV